MSRRLRGSCWARESSCFAHRRVDWNRVPRPALRIVGSTGTAFRGSDLRLQPRAGEPGTRTSSERSECVVKMEPYVRSEDSNPANCSVNLVRGGYLKKTSSYLRTHCNITEKIFTLRQCFLVSFRFCGLCVSMIGGSQ
jgi:hypothetical protein